MIFVPERDIRPSFDANASTNRSGGADSGYHISYGPSSVKVAGPTPKELGGAVLGEMASPPRAHSRIVEKSARDHKVRPRLDLTGGGHRALLRHVGAFLVLRAAYRVGAVRPATARRVPSRSRRRL